MVSLPRRIGRHRTALALSATRLGADRALDWGVIDALPSRRSVDRS